MKRILRAFTIAISLLLNSVFCFAHRSASFPKCSPPFPVKYRLEKSRAVFSGRVVNIKRHSEFEEEVTFKVLKSWKGADSTELVLWNDPHAEAGASYEKGESYLVFAWGSSERLATGACDRYAVLRYAGMEVAQLERITRKSRKR
jgi:hypothetical protein